MRNRGVTQPMRSKEEAHDYRYFPEPDLVPLCIDQEWIERVRQELPELPDTRRQHFTTHYGLPDYDAEVLTASKALADYYEATRAAVQPAQGGEQLGDGGGDA